MLWKKMKKFWKAGLKVILKDSSMPFGNKLVIPSGHPSMPFGNKLVMVSIIAFVLAGCSNETPEVSDTEAAVGDHEVYPSSEDDFDDAESIAEIYRDIYEEAVEMPSRHPSMPSGSNEEMPSGSNEEMPSIPSGNIEEIDTLASLETTQRIIARLGENGYVAVDSENQIDMVGAEWVVDFCKAVEDKKEDKLTIIVMKGFGFQKFDFQTENGNVDIVRGYYQYDKNGCLQNRSTVSYPADVWQYTEEGYLLFEGSYFSEEDFVLTLSDTPEYTALRVLPLDEKCRELNRKYILPVGYGGNNMFLADWSEEDFGDLDFYDIFDIFYPALYQQPVPYTADENLGVGAVYQIPKDLFENVILAHFNIDREMLRSKTTYISEDAAYEYRPRGYYESEYPDIPYPEVVSYTENQDGTITLIVNAVYPNSNTSRAFSHRTVIRPLNEDRFCYVSNQMLPSSLPDSTEGDIWWHSNRLTEEEWKEIYGGND